MVDRELEIVTEIDVDMASSRQMETLSELDICKLSISHTIHVVYLSTELAIPYCFPQVKMMSDCMSSTSAAAVAPPVFLLRKNQLRNDERIFVADNVAVTLSHQPVKKINVRMVLQSLAPVLAPEPVRQMLLTWTLSLLRFRGSKILWLVVFFTFSKPSMGN